MCSLPLGSALSDTLTPLNYFDTIYYFSSAKFKADFTYPLPEDKILDWSKWKQIADDILTHSHTMTPFDAPGKQAF